MTGKKPDYVSYAKNRLGRLGGTDGILPKPVRLNAIVRVISQLHTELMGTTNIGEAIAAKESSTQQAYAETLEGLKVSQVYLGEMIDILQTALLERERKTSKRGRSDLLLELWNSGKSAEEVAAIMGIKPVSIYSWLTRLRAEGRDVRSPIREKGKSVRLVDM